MKPKYLYLVFAGAILGIFYRFWLINLIPQPVLIGDQYDYNRYAMGILQNGLFASSSRLYGYPLFLALVYKIFGIQNIGAVILLQIILDTSCAFLLYFITSKVISNQKAAGTAFILYLLNPFSANFTGLILTEILTLFILLLSVGIFIKSYAAKKTRGLYLVSLLLGYLIQIRPPFLFFSLVCLSGLIYIVRARFKQTLILILSFFLPFIYTLIGNKVYFQELAPFTVDNLFVRELYISLFAERSPAHDSILILDPPMYMFPDEVKLIYADYGKPQNTKERRDIASKYLALSLNKIKLDPFRFALTHLQKMFYVWEKHFIFYYYQPKKILVDTLTYWGNLIILSLSLYGLGSFLKDSLKDKEKLRVCFGYFTLSLFIFITLLHTFSLSEERYSLPAYPFVFLFASYAFFRFFQKINNKKDKR